MKSKFIILSILTFLCGVNAYGQKYPEGKLQQINLGPYIGYESMAETMVYGLGAQYEYRPFKRWSFTLGASYDRSPFAKDTSQDFWNDYYAHLNGTPAPESTLEVQQNQFAVNLGARFYFAKFFISAGVGWSFLDYTLRDRETGEEQANTMNYFYHCVGVGYQISLSKNHLLEPFFNATTGGVPRSIGESKATFGVRYAFRFQ